MRLQDAAQALLEFGKPTDSVDSVQTRRESRHKSCETTTHKRALHSPKRKQAPEHNEEGSRLPSLNKETDSVESSRKRKSTRQPIPNPNKKKRRSPRPSPIRKEKEEHAWKQQYDKLVEYRETHGNCLVPNRYKQNEKLGNWVRTQRAAYKKFVNGEHSRLTESRIARLEKIGFQWGAGFSGRKLDDASWKQHFDNLVEYKKTHGNCRVPQRYKPDTKLGDWVRIQRIYYKKFVNGERESAHITEDRIAQLETIGFEWDIAKLSQRDDKGRFLKGNATWKQHFDNLVEYKKTHGNCRVPQRYEPNKTLGGWVRLQRIYYRKFVNGEMESAHITEDRIAQLKKIGFEWEVPKGGVLKGKREKTKSFSISHS